MDKPHKAYGVAVALYSLGKLFTDDKLQDRYGIKLDPIASAAHVQVSRRGCRHDL